MMTKWHQIIDLQIIQQIYISYAHLFFGFWYWAMLSSVQPIYIISIQLDSLKRNPAAIIRIKCQSKVDVWIWFFSNRILITTYEGKMRKKKNENIFAIESFTDLFIAWFFLLSFGSYWNGSCCIVCTLTFEEKRGFRARDVIQKALYCINNMLSTHLMRKYTISFIYWYFFYAFSFCWRYYSQLCHMRWYCIRW